MYKQILLYSEKVFQFGVTLLPYILFEFFITPNCLYQQNYFQTDRLCCHDFTTAKDLLFIEL